MNGPKNKSTPVSANSQRVGIEIVTDAFTLSIKSDRPQPPKWLIATCAAPQVGDRIWWIPLEDDRKDDISPNCGVITAVLRGNQVTIRLDYPHIDYGWTRRLRADDIYNFSAEDRLFALNGEEPLHGTIGGVA